jgi:hypothetical protein
MLRTRCGRLDDNLLSADNGRAGAAMPSNRPSARRTMRILTRCVCALPVDGLAVRVKFSAPQRHHQLAPKPLHQELKEPGVEPR